MENRPPFDLNAALRRWRDALQNRQALRPEDVAELESHARDAIADLRRKGLTEEEALLVALRRLGPAERLQTEFGKVDPCALWLPRLLWMAFGVAAYLVAMDLTSVAACAVALAGSQVPLGGFTLGWLGLGARVLTVAVVVGAACAFLKFRGERADLWLSRCVQHPVAAIAVFTAAVVSFRLLATGFMPLVVRELTPAAVGQFFVVNAWGAMATFVAAPVVMIAFLLTLLSSRRAELGTGTAALLAVLVLASATGCGPKESANMTASETKQTGQTPLEQTLASWKAGKPDEAADAFLKLDFTRSPLFTKGAVLNYSEPEFVALPAAARDKMAKQVIADLATLKALGRRVADLGKEARSKGDVARADRCAQQLRQCGDALNRPSSLLMVQQVGKAFTKLAAEPAAPGTNP